MQDDCFECEQDEIRLEPSQVVSIEYAGQRDVWDIEVEDTHTVIYNGIASSQCQDMNYDFLQIIYETLSGSTWGLKQTAGTPKSLDNSMERLWQDSSQAEWVVRCRQAGCNKFNIPSVDHNLLDMIGPFHADIGLDRPGTVCSSCAKPMDPRNGRWIHRYPERRWAFAGYHVPQILMPMHYANSEKWGTLLGKQRGLGNTTQTTFLNEVCGESHDSGSKLVTITDIRAAACLPWPRKANLASKECGRYVRRILSIDWGGGGGRVSGASDKKGADVQRKRTSFTSMAVLGLRYDGRVDVIWGHRSLRTHDWEYEARLCVEAIRMFKCSHVAHDYSNAGEGRLLFLLQSGISPSHIVNIRYHGVGHNIMNYHPKTDDHPRDWYSVDKSRSLALVCACIKYGIIRFYQYDYQSADDPGLLHDFLALIEEKCETRLGTDTYTIMRNPNQPDDFAQAVNIGCCTLWHMTNKWPDVAGAAKFEISKEILQAVHPRGRVDWDDM